MSFCSSSVDITADMKPHTIVVVLVVLIAVAKAAVAKEMFEGRERKIEFDDSVGMASHNVV